MNSNSVLPFFLDTYRALENLEVYMRRLEGKPDSEGLKPALATAIVAIRSRLFQAFIGQGTLQ